ncbi:MAG: hypothetical protein ACHQWV_03380 [Nitrospirales bacterium]
MKVKTGKLYAVITGDIVASSRLSLLERVQLHEAMKRAESELKKQLGPAMPLGVDIYAGDSWQVLLSEPQTALRAALLYRAHLLASVDKTDTRLVIGIGTVDFVPRGRVSEGEGEAFQASGRLLTEGKGASRMRFAAPSHPEWDLWDVVFTLLDALIVRQWTAKRALALTGALRHWTQERITTLWKPHIRQQSVVEHLQGAGWEATEQTLDAFERSLSGRL